MKRLAFALLVLAGCRTGPMTPPPEDPFAAQPYAAGPLSPSTKVFLIAGGDDVANFAAEVLEQRTLWRRAGLREDEIACYWAKPTPKALADDFEQYEALAVALQSCRAASPAQVAADLRTVAEHAEGFLYVYVTSHGLASQLRPLEESEHTRTRRFVASLSGAERETLGPAAVGLEAGDGPALGRPRDIARALRAGAEPEDVVFTPRTLAPLLAAFPPSLPKVLVLQACFSGGFIGHHTGSAQGPDRAAELLLATPNLTVLTATAAERPSFGCGSGEARTYFGGTLNVALERALAEHPPQDLSWKDIFNQVTLAIEAMESIQDQRPSVPGFVTTPGP